MNVLLTTTNRMLYVATKAERLWLSLSNGTAVGTPALVTLVRDGEATAYPLWPGGTVPGYGSCHAKSPMELIPGDQVWGYADTADTVLLALSTTQSVLGWETTSSPNAHMPMAMGGINYEDYGGGAGGTTIVIAAAGNPDTLTNMVLVNPATTLAAEAFGLDMPANGRLRNISGGPLYFHVVATLALHAAAGVNQDSFVEFAKNGTVFGKGAQPQTLRNASDIQSFSPHTDVMLEDQEYLEMYVGNATAVNSIVIHAEYLFIEGFRHPST